MIRGLGLADESGTDPPIGESLFVGVPTIVGCRVY